MKLCNMHIQIRLAFENFVAILTWERFDDSKVFKIDMILQGLALRKPFIAYLTLIGFFARVNRLVSFEVHFGHEGFDTVLTLKGSFSGVCKHVSGQFGLFNAGVLTKLAFVLFDSSVDIPKSRLYLKIFEYLSEIVAKNFSF